MTLANVIGLTSYNQNITDNIYIIFNKHYSIAKNKVTCSFVLFFFLEKNWGMIALSPDYGTAGSPFTWGYVIVLEPDDTASR